MNTIIVFRAMIIVIFFCLDIVRADDLANYGKFPHRRQNGNYWDENWSATTFDETSGFDESNDIDARRRGVTNENENEDDSFPHETSVKIKLTQPALGVRVRLGSNLKSVLEEMLQHVNEDIKKTKRLAYASEARNNPHNRANDLANDETTEVYDEVLFYKDDPTLNLQNDWVEDEIRGINRKIKFKPITSLPKNDYYQRWRQPVDYRDIVKLNKRKPNGMLLTYDRGFPRTG